MKKIQREALADMLAQALAHHEGGRLVPAELLYRAVLDQDPRHVDALHFHGVLCWERGERDRAVDLIGRSLALAPQQPAAWSNLGNVRRELGQLDDALRCQRRAVDLDGVNADFWTNLGVVLRDLGRLDEAEQAYRRALELRPQAPVAHHNLGNVLVQLLQPERALASFEQALSLDPRYAEAWCNRARALNLLSEPAEALASVERALELRSGAARDHAVRGDALLALGRAADAAEAFEAAWRQMPEEPYLLGRLAYARQLAADWRDHDLLTERLVAEARLGRPAALPWEMLLCCDDPAAQLAAARLYVGRCVAGLSTASLPLGSGQDRLRVAYLSADFYDHATSQLLARVLELHDRQRFDITLVATTPGEDDAMRQRLRSLPGEFLDVSALEDDEAASLLRSRDFDLAIDLKGITNGARLGLLQRRVAPVQAAFLGYPGTTGASFVDYVLADATLIPPGDEPGYSEQVVRLPHSYQPNDDRRRVDPAVLSRDEVGLPAGSFVFASFNKPAKITPAVFDVWMRLLRRVPSALLWLYVPEPDLAARLQAHARAHAVDAARLAFASRVSSAQHIARQALADLVLDTSPCNGHTTTSEALWAGVPVVTCRGRSFASRVGASLLRAAGLPELVTDDLAGYEDLAVSLAQDPPRLAALRQRVAAARNSSPLFDAGRFALGLERAFATMVARHRAGLPPAAFDVEGRHAVVVPPQPLPVAG